MATIGTSAAFDSTKAQAFAGQLLAALNSGALCLMTSIGHRTGLFGAMRALPPSTSAEIATKAGLNGGYVRTDAASLPAARPSAPPRPQVASSS